MNMTANRAITTHFDDNQYYLAYPEGIEGHYWQRARNWIIRHVLKTSLLNRTAPILEIGCGRGIVVEDLRHHQFQCDGVEGADVPIADSVKGYITTGIRAEELDDKIRARYTALLLLDVLEHIADPGNWLREILRAFPNVSFILITVPARSELWTTYDEFYGHSRRYDFQALREIGRQINWRPAKISYFFHALYLPLYVLARSRAPRSIQWVAPQGPKKHLHQFLAWLLMAEYLLLPRTMPGTSLIACFKKVS